jgi:STE24 endopeptidase
MHAHDSLNHSSPPYSEASAPPPPDQTTPRSDTPDPEKARLYSRIRIKLSIVSLILFFLITLSAVLLGITIYIEQLAYSLTESPYLAVLIFAGIFGVGTGILTFPLRIYSGFMLEHKFGLSNQTFAAWLWDGIKGILVGAVIGIPVFLLFYYFLRTYGTGWWLPVGILMVILSVVLARIAPSVIFPLFYKFKPIDEGSLKERILDRCKETGMNVRGIFQFDMSTKTKKANAAFTGIGKSKRIILGDTLLNEFNDDEIDVVFSHELGHYKLGHIRKGIIVGTAGTFVSLFIAAQLYSLSVGWFGFGDITRPAALPLISLWLGLYGLITGPLDNWLSRRHEYQADRFALQMTRNKDAFVTAMRKLSGMNLSDPEPPRWVEVFFHSHPMINKRIRAAEEFG